MVIDTGNERFKVNRKSLEQLVIKCVVSETQPLSIIYKSSFVSLVKLGLPKD